jgi:Transglycosylase SLT domain
LLAAIAMSSCCSEALARPAITMHQTGDGRADSVAVLSAEAAQHFGIPAAWIRTVIRAESAGNMHAASPKGAIGLMQIMPETWADLRARYHLGADPFDAYDNIIAGTAYLRELYDHYGSPGFLAAYNAGPARWEDHLARGKPLPVEIRDFLVRLTPIAGADASDDPALDASTARSWTGAPLFPTLAANATNSKRATSELQVAHSTNSRSAPNSVHRAPQSNGLFVALTLAGQPQ